MQRKAAELTRSAGLIHYGHMTSQAGQDVSCVPAVIRIPLARAE
jgi:hypothetical protein